MKVMVRSMPLASENEDESQVIYIREIENKKEKKEQNENPPNR
jgi:hypothetical protein